MRISVNWIKEFTNIKLPIDELVAKTGRQLGEVEEVINLGERYKGVTVAKVISCEKHPNADKLSVCKIDDGGVDKKVKRDSNGLVQVVCGAPNVRKGITVAWIPPGAIVPSSYNDEQFKLDSRELRGVISNGMLASGKELSINDDHDGILIIDKPCDPGDDFAEVYKLNDYIIDIENKMFTHRPDCFGQLGVAREIAGIQRVKFTSPDWYLDVIDKFKPGKTKLKLSVKNELADLVPRFMAVPMSGIKVGKSPIMIQSFLSRVGIKPINNIVDITNFTMALTAQPLHAYDYDKLAQLDSSDFASLIIRKPSAHEQINLLNGKTIKPNKDVIAIATKKALIGIGGVMGGASTEVDESTKNIVLECANFDMYSIRRTSMAHGLFTEAVTRFNKGQSARQNDKILAYAMAWVVKLAGGEIAGKIIDDNNAVANLKPIKTTTQFINNKLGVELNMATTIKLLSNVEFIVEHKNDDLIITPPYWRTDIKIAEDVVEEVGRLYGYDKLPLNLPQRVITPPIKNNLYELKNKIRNILSSAGANEILSYSFVNGDLLGKVGQDKSIAYSLNNALSPSLQYYRLSLLPGLLDKVHLNIKNKYNEFSIYEINKTHDKTNIHEDGLPIEEERIACVYVANSKNAQSRGGSAYYLAKYYAEHLLTTLGFVDLRFVPMVHHKPKTDTVKQCSAPFAKNRSAYLKTADGKMLGIVGEISQKTKNALKLPEFCAGFEMDIQMIEQYMGNQKYQFLSKYPSIEQDITLEVDAEQDYQGLRLQFDTTLQKLAKPHNYIVKFWPIDIFAPNKNKKRVTWRVTLSHNNRTLKTVEANSLMEDLSKQLCKNLNAKQV